MVDDQSPSAAVVRIVIADDHPAVCQGLKLLLEPEGIVVCDKAGGRGEALAQVKAHRPDLVLVDLSLGDDNGIDLVGDLQDLGVPALVYSMHEDVHYVKAALAAGARGYVTKREVHRMLVQAIGEIVAGRRFVSPRAALALVDQIGMERTDTPKPELSGQEQNVYRLMGRGEGTSQIAHALKISVRTVESYYSRIMAKLDLETVRDLRCHAIDHYRKHPF